MSLDDDFIPRVNDSGIALASVRYFNSGRGSQDGRGFPPESPIACRGPAKSRRLTAEGVSAPLRVDRGNLNGCRTLSFVRDQQLSRFALIRRLGAEFLRENPMTMSESKNAITQLNIRLFNVIALLIHLFGHNATASH